MVLISSLPKREVFSTRPRPVALTLGLDHSPAEPQTPEAPPPECVASRRRDADLRRAVSRAQPRRSLRFVGSSRRRRRGLGSRRSPHPPPPRSTASAHPPSASSVGEV
ncbi:hypothetical protein GUJ93_ZPchr0004g39875 [Zizania palustris]|uniref:Uncharacterized protein n=1 Tax=Zizania palustris TaxID=103762 RepID=A0A8J5VEY2_ZIZPA|nr:hypothetical protein GUJ93_ZPchr0004g39875 [Zizania palustris]